jgi:hypothetical protein
MPAPAFRIPLDCQLSLFTTGDPHGRVGVVPHPINPKCKERTRDNSKRQKSKAGQGAQSNTADRLPTQAQPTFRSFCAGLPEVMGWSSSS